MSASYTILDGLPSLCKKLSELVEILRTYGKNNYCLIFWDTVYTHRRVSQTGARRSSVYRQAQTGREAVLFCSVHAARKNYRPFHRLSTWVGDTVKIHRKPPTKTVAHCYFRDQKGTVNDANQQQTTHSA